MPEAWSPARKPLRLPECYDPGQRHRGQGMQEPGMEWYRWRAFAAGIALSIGYCAIFLLTWRLSFNQWYLPAGLRLASLLLIPTRYWPYVLAGDAAALLFLRAPKSAQYSAEWAYFSPLLLAPLIAVVPGYFRSRLASDEAIARKLPTIAFVSGVWSCIVGMGLNFGLNGPSQLVTVQNFISYSVGNYLGILMSMLPCMLWRLRSKWSGQSNEIVQSVGIATLMVAALLGAVFLTDTHGTAVQLVPLVFMLLPVFYLTALHGWHGAAIGTFLIGAAISFALPRTNIAGAYDGVVLLAQIILSVASAGLLVTGSQISSLFEKSSAALLSQLKAIEELRSREDGAHSPKGMLQTIFRSNELRLRENAILIATARRDLDSYRHEVVQSLKEEEQYERAMEAQSAGMLTAKLIDLQKDYLYPLEIETHGLYAALTGPAFLDTWQKRTRIYERLEGDQHFISLPLRLATYRAIIRAMESMQDHAPSEYDLRIRVWRRGNRSGATVLVKCVPTVQSETITSEALDAFNELRARVIAYDGVLKCKGPRRLSFLMSEITSST